MSLERRKSLYIDVAKAGGENPLLDKKTVNQALTPSFVQGDRLTLSLFFRSIADAVTTTVSDAVELPAGAAVVVGGAVKGDLDAGTLLFYASAFSLQGSGDDARYDATLDLDTAEVEDALAESDSVEIRIDVEVQDAGNAERLTYQFDAVLYRQVYAAQQPPPALGTQGDGLSRVAGGSFQIKDVVTGLWHGLWLENRVLTVGEGEE
jgi:hypothetical protein